MLIRRQRDLTASRALTLWQNKNGIKLDKYDKRLFKRGYIRGRVSALLRIAGNGIGQRNEAELIQMDLMLSDFVEHEINPKIGVIQIGAYVYVDVGVFDYKSTILCRVLDVTNDSVEISLSGTVFQIPIGEILRKNNIDADVSVDDVVSVAPFDGKTGVVFRIDGDLAYVRFYDEARAFPIYQLRKFANDRISTDASP